MVCIVGVVTPPKSRIRRPVALEPAPPEPPAVAVLKYLNDNNKTNPPTPSLVPSLRPSAASPRPTDRPTDRPSSDRLAEH